MKIYLDFSITGQGIDVEKINDILGFLPTKSSDIRYNFWQCRIEEMREPYWNYKTEKVHTEDSDIQIGEFLKKFDGKADKLKAYFTTCGHMPKVSLGLIICPDEYNEEGNEVLCFNSVSISRENIKKLADLNCEIYFD
ncbi:MAG: DUF4279 domain-containing protein [Clostridiales bacterium]|nr:DUF4279 domain-containing protein [Clostridiales bacterium]